jgi:hypothetical protein
MPDDKQHVCVVTRVDADENDHVIGVWAKEEDILPDLKKLFEWLTYFKVEGSWILGADDDSSPSEIAYITRCTVQ